MVTFIITLGLIISTIYIQRKAKKENSFNLKLLTIILGFITMLFVPVWNAIGLEKDESIIFPALATVTGIYCIFWGIIKMFKTKE